MISASSESGRALLHESGYTLGKVARVTELTLKVTLDVELLRQTAPARALQCLLGARQAKRRRCGQLPRHPLDDRAELSVLHAAPDQAPILSLFGTQLFPEKRKSARPCLTHQAWQKPGATAVGHESDLDEGLNEGGTARGNHQVACECDVGSRSGGDSIDCCDDRDRQPAQCEHQRLVALLDRLAEVHGRL